MILAAQLGVWLAHQRQMHAAIARASEVGRAVEAANTVGGIPAAVFKRNLPRWRVKAEVDAALEAFHTPEEDRYFRELAVRLGLPHRQAGTAAVIAFRWLQEGYYPEAESPEELRRIWRGAVLVYDNDLVEPIRLGGEHVYALDALPEIVMTVQELVRPRVDPATILLGLGFDWEEIRLLIVNKIEGTPLKDAAAILRWTPQRVEAVRRRCKRRAVRLRGGGLPRPTAAVRIGDRDWPSGLFERLAGGRLVLRTPIP